MNRPAAVWCVFLVCAGIGLSALAWLSRAALRLETAEAAAQRRAVVEENIRLALWRMDSAVTPLLATETSRPASHYAPFVEVASVSDSFGQREEGPPPPVRIPSPLRWNRSPYVTLHFEIRPDGSFSSPEGGEMPPKTAKQSAVSVTNARLAEIRDRVGRYRIEIALADTSIPETLSTPIQAQSPDVQPAPQQPFAQEMQAQVAKGQNEFQARAKNVMDNTGQALAVQQGFVPPESPGTVSPMRPVWVDARLFLLRRVSENGESRIQGVWLNWPAIREWLLTETEDLLPEADLAAVQDPTPEASARMMASLPVKIVEGALPPVEIPAWTPMRLALLTAWGFVLAALGVGALLLRGTLRLSERRAAFVSAVTHELRTPLTTFQMYTEMLSTGMVEEEKKRRYFDTLQTEAERLTHLVENVLAYARLERGRVDGRRQTLTVADLLDRATERLEARAAQAGMQLVEETDPACLDDAIHTDPAAVEQILFNLVDNACKYAAGAEDRRVHVRATCSRRRLDLRVCDYGPGLSREDARRLFRPFRKSAREAADSAPGVGLGLALSRRLARSLGGELRLERASHPGACFRLSLPLGRTGRKSEGSSDTGSGRLQP